MRALVYVLSVLNPDLRAREADRLVAESEWSRHGHERHAHLFARGEEHVHFARWRFLVDLSSQIDQHVGVLAHGADHHHDLVALILRANRSTGRGQDLGAVCQAGSAKFLDDERHGRAD